MDERLRHIDLLERSKGEIAEAIDAAIVTLKGSVEFRDAIEDLLVGTPHEQPEDGIYDFDGLYGRLRNALKPVEGRPSVSDEECVPHAFVSRAPYEPGDDRDIWCRDCEYHRDHKIHSERTDGRHEVEIVVNGQPVSVVAGPIRTVIAAAITKSGQIGRPIDQWVLRTRDGEIIPHELPDGHEYALSGGQQFFLHLGLPPIERTEGRPQDKAASDPPWTLFMDLKLTGTHGGLIRDHHASRPVTDGTGFHAMYQRWQELTEAPIEQTEGRPPEADELKEALKRQVRDFNLVCDARRKWQDRAEAAEKQVADLQSQIETLKYGIDSNLSDAIRELAEAQSQIETLTASLKAAYSELWATYGETSRVQPIFNQIDQALKGQLAAGGRSEGRATWQPIETAPRDVVCWFWIRPKTAEEAWKDTSGKPINPQFKPYPTATKYGHWSAIQTATHWMPYDLPTAPSASGEDQ